MIDMKKMCGAVAHGKDEIIFIMEGEFWGPYTMDQGRVILEALRKVKR